jgi:hypothetical protein
MFHDRRRFGAIQPKKAAAVAGYVGPGDVVTAVNFWGLRAVTNAAIGSNAIDITWPGSNLRTYGTVAGGGLNLTAINADLAFFGGPGEITKFYDQVGGFHYTLSGGSGALLDLSATFNPLPYVNFSSSPYFTASGLPWPTLPATLVAVALNVSGSATSVMFGESSGGVILFRTSTNNQVSIYNGGAVFASAACTDGQFNSIIGNFTSPSSGSFATVNNANGSTADPGSNSGTTNVGSLGCDPGGGQLWTGSFMEVMVCATGFSPTQRTNMYNNHHAYYGV